MLWFHFNYFVEQFGQVQKTVLRFVTQTNSDANPVKFPVKRNADEQNGDDVVHDYLPVSAVQQIKIDCVVEIKWLVEN